MTADDSCWYCKQPAAATVAYWHDQRWWYRHLCSRHAHRDPWRGVQWRSLPATAAADS